MRPANSFAPALALVLLAGAAAQQANPELAKAQARANVHNKRVLAVLAADDADFAAALKKDRTVSRTLLYEVETVQLTGEAAHARAVAWQFPDALQQRPALVVLDAGGEVLARLLPDTFLTDGELNGEALLAQLQPHFCAPVDAEKKLAAGIAEAKKTGRNVFVRFDAPW